jgi:hypothetical protein
MIINILKNIFLLMPLEMRVRIYFLYRHRYWLSLSSPATFSEQVNYRKFNYMPIYSVLADKYQVRDYVSGIIGSEYLIPLLYVAESKDFVEFPNLDGHCVAKTNHGSGPEHMEFLPSAKSQLELFEKFKYALNNEFEGVNFAESHYSSIPRKILIEKRLGGSKVPEDFKFHIFERSGDPIWFLQVDDGRFEDHRRNYYDSQLGLMNLEVLHPNGEYILPDFDLIREMADLGVKLAAGLKYARIDFYLVDSKIYFGEITLTPGSGFEKFSDVAIDRLFGGYWH